MQQAAQDLVKVEYGTFRPPEKVMEEAAHVARVFQHQMQAIKDSNGDAILYRMFERSRHITRPGWQLLGSMYRVTAGIVEGSLKFVEYGEINGFEATAEAIYVPTGARISTAVAMCLNDEKNWDMRPVYQWEVLNGKNVKKQVGTTPVSLFQLGSMAQTRACSKVLANLLSYVAIMAGCSGTSAEEMTGEPLVNGSGETSRPAAASKAPQRTPNGGDTITENQVNRLFGLNKNAGRSRDGLGVILATFGYTAPSDEKDPVEAAAWKVKKGDFDKIQTEVMKTA